MGKSSVKWRHRLVAALSGKAKTLSHNGRSESLSNDDTFATLRMRRNEATKVIRKMEQDGFTVERTGGGHYKITRPDMVGPVFASSTPSNDRAIKEMQANIRRKMLEGTSQTDSDEPGS